MVVIRHDIKNKIVTLTLIKKFFKKVKRFDHIGVLHQLLHRN